ncbi:MFS transporter [Curtobacterium sp. MCBD17_013]|uniref:MFS transporter n=1 Tax=unclassified Curtobacterium TaxID=257496 RepID=UPI000DA7A01D|nr:MULTISPECIES: MFS transporter [unclassified Curtobacterium]PZE77852.1 MFS transporter [Curtobacterium sp. MCBD17_019]PZF61536.1 MFS transporter [Curtobacterium sp. MCBD17_013]WIE54586.1 MFS transporter [Curtobacterium sp. MCBD17_003]
MALTEVQRQRAVHGTRDKKSAAIGAAVGTCVENYDFLAYGTASALYFGTAFFPGADPLVGTLLSFATLGVGFAMRPLGGIIGGYLGDKIGRKPVLVAALLVMGLATFAIGLLPTYQTVGVLAPILLVAVRVIQGVAFGAEWGGAILMAYEHAPWRHRGRYSAIPTAGNPAGVFLANIVFLFSVHLGGEWAWRVPFLASAVLVIAGLIIRARVSESPEFEDVKDRGETAKNPLLKVLKDDWRNLLRVIGLRLVESAGFYVVVTYILSYISGLDADLREVGLVGLCIATAIGVGSSLFWGDLTDKFGRKPIYLVGSILSIAFGFPMFLMLNSQVPVLIVFVYVIGLPLIHDMLAGTQGAWFSELFSTDTRSSGASIGYQLAAAISGFIPFIATALAAAIGWGGVSLLYVAAGVVGVVTVLLTRETWSRKERAYVDEVTSAVPTAVVDPRVANQS